MVAHGGRGSHRCRARVPERPKIDLVTDNLAEQNRRAWEAQAFESWSRAYGTPAEQARKLAADPAHKLRHFLPYLGDVAGKKIANPLGSHGRLAVAFALMGANVTVYDLSEPNRRYALELAQAAGVELTYRLGDFGTLDLSDDAGTFDAVAIDHGVLHYFTDLEMLVGRLYTLLRPGGQLVINEFHPLLKKVVSLAAGQPALTGDYFSSTVEAVPVAYADFADRPDALPYSLVRRWTLGEIVTAVFAGGFVVTGLLELPDVTFPTLPGSFVLHAKRDEANNNRTELARKPRAA